MVQYQYIDIGETHQTHSFFPVTKNIALGAIFCMKESMIARMLDYFNFYNLQQSENAPQIEFILYENLIVINLLAGIVRLRII